MTNTPPQLYLERIDPDRNMARFYTLSIQPTLFGTSSLVRVWGRIGSKGRCRIELHDKITDAEHAYTKVLSAKMQRGYRPVEASQIA